MPQPKQTAPSVIYQIKITLKDTKPPVWRRVQLSGGTTLGKLHEVIQTVMGWQDYHLHSFTVGAVEYGVFEPELRLRSEHGVKLSQIIPGEKFKFTMSTTSGTPGTMSWWWRRCWRRSRV